MSVDEEREVRSHGMGARFCDEGEKAIRTRREEEEREDNEQRGSDDRERNKQRATDLRLERRRPDAAAGAGAARLLPRVREARGRRHLQAAVEWSGNWLVEGRYRAQCTGWRGWL